MIYAFLSRRVYFSPELFVQHRASRCFNSQLCCVEGEENNRQNLHIDQENRMRIRDKNVILCYYNNDYMKFLFNNQSYHICG